MMNLEFAPPLLCLAAALSLLWQHHHASWISQRTVSVIRLQQGDTRLYHESTTTTRTIQHYNNEAMTPAGPGSLNLSEAVFPLSAYMTLLQEPYRSSYPCTPRGIHLAQKDNVHVVTIPRDFHNQTTDHAVSMTLSFRLDYEKCAHAQPRIFWYRQGNHPELTIVPDRPPLQFNFTSSIPNFTTPSHPFQSDWIYHVTLPNVKAGLHRYWYRIEVTQNHVHDNTLQQGQGDQNEARVGTIRHELLRVGRRRAAQAQHKSKSNPVIVGATPTYSFLTPPLPHTPTSIALVGDLGQTINSTKTMAHIFHDSISQSKHPTTLLLIAGDMSYADSDPHRWTSWFDLMEPLTRSLTMHVAAGNHEIECDNATLEIFKHYENYFYNPNRMDDVDLLPIEKHYRQTLPDQYCSTPSQFQGHYNYGNAFYSFQHGYIHFIVLSSYSDSSEGSPQYNWLVQELSGNVDRTVTPWVIVSFHSPLYTTFNGHVNEQQALGMKESMEPLFNEYGVNLVVCGHDHGYMRTHSLAVGETVDPNGKAPIYLTLGAGGNREQHARGYRNETYPEDWVAFRDLRDFGYLNLLVTNATHAVLNWVRDGVTKEGIDDKNVWIVNQHVPTVEKSFS